MSVRTIVVALVTCLLLGGCYGDLALGLQENESVVTFELPGGKEHVLSGDDRRRFGVWVTNNRTGWVPYTATAPARGTFARAANVTIQFIDGSAIAHTQTGLWEKSVQSTDYEYLR